MSVRQVWRVKQDKKSIIRGHHGRCEQDRGSSKALLRSLGCSGRRNEKLRNGQVRYRAPRQGTYPSRLPLSGIDQSLLPPSRQGKLPSSLPESRDATPRVPGSQFLDELSSFRVGRPGRGICLRQALRPDQYPMAHRPSELEYCHWPTAPGQYGKRTVTPGPAMSV